MPEKLQIAAIVISTLALMGSILWCAWLGVRGIFRMQTSLEKIEITLEFLAEKHESLDKRIGNVEEKADKHQSELSGIHTHLKLAPNLKARIAT